MRYRLAALGTVFSTRERGAKVRGEIESALRQHEEHEPLVIDFNGVELISFSFADEVVGTSLANLKAGDLGERPILVANANPDVLDPIERSLNRRDLIGGILTEDGSVRIIGEGPHLQLTFDAARRRGEFRTSELASDLGISVGACNNRLKPLLDACLVTRQRTAPQSGGREYIYRVARLSILMEQSVG